MAKKVITLVLVLFVVVSIVYLIKQEAGRSDATAVASMGDSNNGGRDYIAAYYFHGIKRCPTCLRIEAQTEQAIEQGYSDRLLDSTLTWQVINFEDPENEHFVGEYQLAVSSVILAKYRGGIETEWKNLDSIWELAWEDEAFIRYIQSEVKTMLDES